MILTLCIAIIALGVFAVADGFVDVVTYIERKVSER